MDGGYISSQAIVTLAYSLAALFSVGGAFSWMRFLSRRHEQSSAGKAPDLRGLDEAATATAVAMFCAGAAFLYSLLL